MTIHFDQIKQDFVPTIKSCLSDKYLAFSGKADQSEFIIFSVFALICVYLSMAIFTPPIASIIGIALFIPGLAVTIRRLNDAAMSNILALIMFIPFINLIFVVFLALQPSK
ncbi:MAG: DUF805 domain-containing protein [Micavibrio sp.]